MASKNPFTALGFDPTHNDADSPGVAAKKARIRAGLKKKPVASRTPIATTQDLQPDGSHAKLAGLFQSLAQRRSSK